MKPETRDRILTLADKRLALVEDLHKRPSGLGWCAEHTAIADEIAQLLYDDLTAGKDRAPGLALIATGGFGRSELSPKSDIDVTVVPEDESSTELDAIIRQLFQDLHWAYCTALRLDVGYAYRLISDAPGLDVKSRTGLMDMRLLAGSQDLFRNLERALQNAFSAGEFILAKINERQEMYERFNDTPLVIEPHLKEGAGGLRDFQCANWIGEAIGERPARPTAAYDAVVYYRNLLHYVTKKTQDQLSRTRTDEIADLLGIDSSEITSQIAVAGSELHNHYLRSKEKLHEGRFALSTATLAVKGEVRILPASTAGEAAVGVAIATSLGLHVSDLPMRADNDQGGPSAAFAVTCGEKTLRNLDRCTLLEQLVPELTRCRTLVPADGLHTYTVMEHTLRVVRLLDSVEPPGFLGELKSSVTDLTPLYLAALLHDVGKVDPEQDHSLLGTDIARNICRRWDLSESLVETVAWLVQEHLSMARVIRIRDLMHPGTIDEFAGIVGDTERLKLLTLLTWADVNAVSEGSWTAAQETFLRHLYETTLLHLQGQIPAVPDASLSRQRLLRQLKSQPEDEGRLSAFLDSLPAYYLTSTNADVLRLHMELADRATKGQPTIEQFQRTDLGATDITVCALDTPGLLSKLLGVLYAYDLSLAGIRACTTSTEPHVAIDVFTVNFAGRPVPPATMSMVSRALLDVISKTVSLEEILRSKGKDPGRSQQFFTYTYLPGTPGVLEIRAPRGRGMAFRFSRLFATHGWNILAARVGQWAGNGAAAFYLTDSQGASLQPDQIRQVLLENPTGISLEPTPA